MTEMPDIIRRPLKEQRFTTLGDWWKDEYGKFTISITQMPDWRHEFLVLIHELTEWAICQKDGVKTSDCDDFDAMWERGIKSGIFRPESEAGFDRACPYREGHVWGARMERLFAFLLGVRWKEYGRVCDEMMRERGAL